MNIFAEIERLINEHGSATILKERIALMRDQFDVLGSQKQILENEISLLKSQIVSLEIEIQRLSENNKNLEINNSNLKHQLDVLHARNPDKHFCEHCGSENIKRSGCRPSGKKIAGIAIKDSLYVCNDCGKESAFTMIPK